MEDAPPAMNTHEFKVRSSVSLLSLPLAACLLAQA